MFISFNTKNETGALEPAVNKYCQHNNSQNITSIGTKTGLKSDGGFFWTTTKTYCSMFYFVDKGNTFLWCLFNDTWIHNETSSNLPTIWNWLVFRSNRHNIRHCARFNAAFFKQKTAWIYTKNQILAHVLWSILFIIFIQHFILN